MMIKKTIAISSCLVVLSALCIIVFRGAPGRLDVGVSGPDSSGVPWKRAQTNEGQDRSTNQARVRPPKVESDSYYDKIVADLYGGRISKERIPGLLEESFETLPKSRFYNILAGIGELDILSPAEIAQMFNKFAPPDANECQDAYNRVAVHYYRTAPESARAFADELAPSYPRGGVYMGYYGTICTDTSKLAEILTSDIASEHPGLGVSEFWICRSVAGLVSNMLTNKRTTPQEVLEMIETTKLDAAFRSNLISEIKRCNSEHFPDASTVQPPEGGRP